MLTALAVFVLLAVVAGTVAVASHAAGGCLLSNLWLWCHFDDAVAAVGQLAAFVATSIAGDE